MRFLLAILAVIALLSIPTLDACDRPASNSTGAASASSSSTSSVVINGGSADGPNNGSLDIFGKRGRLRRSATGDAARILSNRGKKPFKGK